MSRVLKNLDLADNLAERGPLLSIVIVSYNAATTIRSAIESVISQENIELIVIDGASSDGTLSIVKEYDKYISFWVSEIDNGIYEAMNKGVLHTSGKWIYFLGSDDMMTPNVVHTIKSVFELADCDLIYGAVRYNTGRLFRSGIGIKTLLNNTIHHQSAFYKRELLLNHKFDETFKIIADYELNLIIYLTSRPTKRILQIVAICSDGGSSHNVPLSLVETNQVRGKHVAPLANICLSFILKIKYFLRYVLL